MKKHVIGTDAVPGPLAHLTLREVRVSALQRALRAVAKDHGPSAAKMTRSVYRGIADLAARHDAIPLNPVRSIGSLSSKVDARPTVKDARRSCTHAERDAVTAYADTNLKATSRDLGNLIAFLGGTGARIGEACPLRWSALDLKAGTADLGPTAVSVRGKGLVIQETGKTQLSHRTVALPASWPGSWIDSCAPSATTGTSCSSLRWACCVT